MFHDHTSYEMRNSYADYYYGSCGFNQIWPIQSRCLSALFLLLFDSLLYLFRLLLFFFVVVALSSFDLLLLVVLCWASAVCFAAFTKWFHFIFKYTLRHSGFSYLGVTTPSEFEMWNENIYKVITIILETNQ